MVFNLLTSLVAENIEKTQEDALKNMAQFSYSLNRRPCALLGGQDQSGICWWVCNGQPSSCMQELKIQIIPCASESQTVSLSLAVFGGEGVGLEFTGGRNGT